MGVPMRREIIVACDGSPHSCGAIKWAAQECRAQRMELTLCHVWDGPRAEREAAITEQQRKLAGRVLFDGVGLAERLLPGRDVRSIWPGEPPGRSWSRSAGRRRCWWSAPEVLAESPGCCSAR